MNTQTPKPTNPQNRTRFSDIYGMPTMNEDEKQQDRKIGMRWLALLVLAIPLCWLWFRTKPVTAYSPGELVETIYARKMTSTKFQSRIPSDMVAVADQIPRAWQRLEDELQDDGASHEASTQIVSMVQQMAPQSLPNVAERAYLRTSEGTQTVWVVGCIWRDALAGGQSIDGMSLRQSVDADARKHRFWMAIVNDNLPPKVLAIGERRHQETIAGRADTVQILYK